MVKNGNFITITNREIYNQLAEFKCRNEEEHIKIMNMIGSYKSQVSRLYWAVSGLGALVVILLGVILNHLGG